MDVNLRRNAYIVALRVMGSSKCEAVNEFQRKSWVGWYEILHKKAERKRGVRTKDLLLTSREKNIWGHSQILTPQEKNTWGHHE